jgi:hypothetical protein
MYAKPTLIWTASHPTEGMRFDKNYMVMRVSGSSVLLLTDQHPWFVLNITSQIVEEVAYVEEEKELLFADENKAYVLDMDDVENIENYQRGKYVYETNVHVQLESKSISMTDIPSFCDESAHLPSVIMGWSARRDLLLKLEDSDQEIDYPTIWNLSLNHEKIGGFISWDRPYIFFNHVRFVWYVVVMNPAHKIEVYMISLKACVGSDCIK